ncbi:MAG: AAA family ATPase, partial [Chthonomonadales bacterium]|nr:AAA family ATPase [Chthonomonadales bacterium]
MTASDLAQRLQARPSGNGWTARCPAHPDRAPSLSISQADNGRILLHCHAGCTPEAVCSAIGIALRDLMPPGDPAGHNGAGPRIVATYEYTDEQGRLLYEVVRMDPKAFRQRRPDGHGGHVWDMKGVRRVLYRLPAVLDAVRHRKPVWIVEGEKDADALATIGLCATTNSGGAGKWLPDAAETLRQAHVVVMPDNDDPGRAHADIVANALHGIAASVRILALPDLPPKGDVSDWLSGKDPQAAAAELRKLARATPIFSPTARPAPRERPIPVSEVPIRRIEWLWPARLARGEITEICGDPGLGKSMLGVEIAALLSRGAPWPDGTHPPEPVSTMLLSAEDD